MTETVPVRRVDTRVLERVLDALAKRRRRAVLPHVVGELLDVGCGDNALVAEHGRGVGLDVTRLEEASGRMVLADASFGLPFADASFDTVTFLACLNHIPDRVRALVEARRVLRPGGRVIATMIPPGLSRVWHRLVRNADPDQVQRDWAPGEVYGIRRAEVRRLLDGAGFTMREEVSIELGVNRVYVAEP